MTLPPAERKDPREFARSTATSAVFHEVVIGASKVLHDKPLDARDERALRWARTLIEAADNNDLVYTMPASTQLAESVHAASALRRAAAPSGDDASVALRAIREAVDAVLSGNRGSEVAERINQLQKLFTVVSRLALSSEIASHGGAPWRLPPTTLPS